MKIILTITILLISIIGYWYLSQPTEVIVNYPTDEKIWCYIKTIQSGDSFGDNKAGNVDYAIIHTSSGIDVYKRCELMK